MSVNHLDRIGLEQTQQSAQIGPIDQGLPVLRQAEVGDRFNTSVPDQIVNRPRAGLRPANSNSRIDIQILQGPRQVNGGIDRARELAVGYEVQDFHVPGFCKSTDPIDRSSQSLAYLRKT